MEQWGAARQGAGEGDGRGYENTELEALERTEYPRETPDTCVSGRPP